MRAACFPFVNTARAQPKKVRKIDMEVYHVLECARQFECATSKLAVASQSFRFVDRLSAAVMKMGLCC